MAYSIVPFQTSAHWDALEALWRKNLAAGRRGQVSERLRWLYGETPDGPTGTWLAIVAETGAVVGCASFFRRRVLVGETAYTAGILGDFAMDGAHRAAGPALALQRALIKAGAAEKVDFLYVWPNDKARAIFKHVGHAAVGTASVWVRSLRSAGLLADGDRAQKILAERIAPRLPAAAAALAPAVFPKVARVLGNPLVTATAAWALDGAMAALDAGRRLPGLGTWTVEVLPRADARVDDLWKRAIKPSVAAERSAAYLNWRYGPEGGEPAQLIGLVERGSKRLGGYAVVAPARDGARTLDLFCEDMGPALDQLILGMCQHARGMGAKWIELIYLGGDALAHRLRRHLFVKGAPSRSVMLYAPATLPEAHRALLQTPESWLMIDGDLDM